MPRGSNIAGRRGVGQNKPRQRRGFHLRADADMEPTVAATSYVDGLQLPDPHALPDRLPGDAETANGCRERKKSVWRGGAKPRAEVIGQANADRCPGDIRLHRRYQPLADPAVERGARHAEFGSGLGYPHRRHAGGIRLLRRANGDTVYGNPRAVTRF